MLLKDDIGRTRIKTVDDPATYLHIAVTLADEEQTVLSDETFRLVELQGEESISNPFEFQLTLHANSESPNDTAIAFRDIIGRPVIVGIARPLAEDDLLADRDESYLRFRLAVAGIPVPGLTLFSGMAASFAMHEPGVYRLTLRPSLWKLTLANRYCVYPHKNVRDAIKAVCEHHGVKATFRGIDDDDKRNLAVNRVQDWLQAGETDYEFVQRLMGKAHLYYYFEHRYDDDLGGIGHVLVFANDTQYPQVEGTSTLQYTHTSAEELGLDRDDVITQYGYEQTLTQSGVDGAFVRQESASSQDTVANVETYYVPKPAGADEPSLRLYKIYQYGVTDALAREYTQKTTDAIAAAAAQFSGSSRCPTFRSGHTFQAVEYMGPDVHPNPVRPTLDGQWFVLTRVEHEASADGIYQNKFTALGADGLATPVSVRDTHQGMLLATVVSAGSGVPPSDWRYYSKNNFDPVQSDVTDDESNPARTSLWGVYVRFSSDPPNAPAVWVKLAAHMQTAPEIGALVVIARANDESELPEVQNIVEAGGHMTVKSPTRWIPDTRVGGNFSTAYGDSKSVHFGATSLSGPAELKQATDLVEEKYKTEQFRDVSYSKGARYSYETANGGRDDVLSVSESYGSTDSKAAGKNRSSDEDFDKVYSKSVYGESESHHTVNRDSKSYETITGKSYSESTVGSSERHSTVNTDSKNYETVTGKNYSESTLGSSEHHSTVNADSKSYETVTGQSYSESTVGSSERYSTTNGDSKSYESVTGQSYNESTVGSSEHHSTVTGSANSYETYKSGRYTEQVVHGDSKSYSNVTGVENSRSEVGVTTRNSAIGLSNDNAITGAHFGFSLTGASLDIKVVATLGVEVNAYGLLYRTEKVGIDLRTKMKSPASAELEMTGVKMKMPVMDSTL